MRLTPLVAETPFALYGIPADDWSGPCFVGDVIRTGGQITVVQLVYLDEIDGTTMGALVSTASDAGAEPLDTHLARFVSRFDPKGVERGMRRRSRELFSAARFSRASIATTFAGATLGATTMAHERFPVRALRVAVVTPSGPLDIVVAGWRLDPAELIGGVRPVDAGFARAFDAADEHSYPPREWTEDAES